MHIRAHNGVLFTYQGFSWRTFEGVFSSSALRRIKAKMVALEGLFRELEAATGRDRDSILRRMVALRVPRGVEDDPAIGVRAPPCVRHRQGTPGADDGPAHGSRGLCRW